MVNSKIIQLYIRFSLKEKRSFRKWIKSDFVNKNEEVLRFFNFIDTRSAWNATTVSKEKAHAYLYPNEPYNDLKIRHLMWLTTEVAEAFVAYQAMLNRPSLQQELLSAYYIEKDMFTQASQMIEEGMDILGEQSVRSAAYHHQLFGFYKQYYLVNSRNNRAEDFRLQESIDHFTQSTILETLRFACIAYSLQRISAFKVEQHLLAPVMNLLPDSPFLEQAPVRIYYQLYGIITESMNDTGFDDVLHDLKHHQQLFSHQDLKELYLLAISFCVRKSNQNMLAYSKRAFDLYVFAVEEGFLLENNEISRFSFTNIVTLGVKLGEIEKSRRFVERFAAHIAPDFRQNTIDFNTAKLFYAAGQLKKALRILVTNEFNDTLWNLNAKYLILKVLFETEDWPAFQTQLVAFRKFIQRKSNVGYHSDYFKKVVAALVKLLELMSKPHKRKGFAFDVQTPDLDWFNRALEQLNNSEY